MQGQLQGWKWRWRAPSRPTGTILALVATAWILWRTRDLWRPIPSGPGRIRALGPLLARTRRVAPPAPGDTARTWLDRLAVLRPDRQEALARLADAVDAEAYGQGDRAASALAKAEAASWRGWRPGPSPS
jgi:hypothetical protein